MSGARIPPALATVRVTTLGEEFLRGGLRGSVWWRTSQIWGRRSR